MRLQLQSVSYCPTFLVLDVTKRFEIVKQLALCINCLRKGHFSSKFNSKLRCKKCHSLHHTNLDFVSSTSGEKELENNASVSHSTQISLVTRTTKRAFIPTAVVLLRYQTGTFHSVRALLDSCSELNFITEETAKRLKLKCQYDVQEVHIGNC